MQFVQVMFSTTLRSFREPCGGYAAVALVAERLMPACSAAGVLGTVRVWHPRHPSALTATCSKTNGPRVSVWHLVQIMFWSAVDFRLLLRRCRARRAVAARDQAFVHLVVKGILKAGLVSAWHWKQSAGCAAFSSFSSSL